MPSPTPDHIVEHRLARHFDAIAGVVAPDDDLSPVPIVRAARHRRFRRRRIAVATAALSIGAATVVTVAVASSSSPNRVRVVAETDGDSATENTAASPDAGAVDPNLLVETTMAPATMAPAAGLADWDVLPQVDDVFDWRLVEPTPTVFPAYGWATERRADGLLYTVATMPTSALPSPVDDFQIESEGVALAEVSSTDGLAWSDPRPTQVLDQFNNGDATWLTYVRDGGTMYTLATAAFTKPIDKVTSPNGDLVVVMQNDGADPTMAPLPDFDLRSWGLGQRVAGGWTGAAAAGPSGVLLATVARVDNPTDPDAASSETLVYFGSESSGFRRIAFPEPDRDRQTLWAGYAAGRYVLIAWELPDGPDGTPVSTAYFSADGANWTVGPSATGVVPTMFGVVGDNLVSTDASARVAVLGTDGWRTGTVPGFRDRLDDGTPVIPGWSTQHRSRAGAIDIVMLTHDRIRAAGGITITRDRWTMRRASDNDPATFTNDATGEVFEPSPTGDESPVRNTGDQVEIVDESGNRITTFSVDEVWGLPPDLVDDQGADSSDQQIDPSIVMASADGVSWSNTPLDDIVGERGTVVTIYETARGIAIVVRLARTDANGARIVRVYEGTRRNGG